MKAEILSNSGLATIDLGKAKQSALWSGGVIAAIGGALWLNQSIHRSTNVLTAQVIPADGSSQEDFVSSLQPSDFDAFALSVAEFSTSFQPIAFSVQSDEVFVSTGLGLDAQALVDFGSPIASVDPLTPSLSKPSARVNPDESGLFWVDDLLVALSHSDVGAIDLQNVDAPIASTLAEVSPLVIARVDPLPNVVEPGDIELVQPSDHDIVSFLDQDGGVSSTGLADGIFLADAVIISLTDDLSAETVLPDFVDLANTGVLLSDVQYFDGIA